MGTSRAISCFWGIRLCAEQHCSVLYCEHNCRAERTHEAAPCVARSATVLVPCTSLLLRRDAARPFRRWPRCKRTLSPLHRLCIVHILHPALAWPRPAHNTACPQCMCHHDCFRRQRRAWKGRMDDRAKLGRKSGLWTEPQRLRHQRQWYGHPVSSALAPNLRLTCSPHAPATVHARTRRSQVGLVME